VVNPELHDRAARVALAVSAPCLRPEGAGQRHVRLGEHDAPERAGVDQLPHASRGPEPAERVAHHERDAGPLARAPHPLACLDAVRDRLLHQNVAAALRARQRLLLVHVVGRHEHDPFDVRVLDRLLEALRRCAAEALGELRAPRLVAAEAGDELEAGALGGSSQAGRPHARPDHGDPGHPSCSRSQSAATGRVLYGTLAQPWFPSS
jgi:hypothetical protein